jgi:hypothetical protein
MPVSVSSYASPPETPSSSSAVNSVATSVIFAFGFRLLSGDPNGPCLLHQNRRSVVHCLGKGHVMNMYFATGDLVEFSVGDLNLCVYRKLYPC